MAQKVAEPIHQIFEISDQKSINTSNAKIKKKWYQYEGYNGLWIEETRGALMVVSTVVLTITYQPAISPPGGLWQNTSSEGEACSIHTCETGKSVLASTSSVNFISFMYFNTVSFTCSIATIFMCISGISLRNKFTMVLLAFCMCLNLASLSLAYVAALFQVTPEHVFHEGYNFIIGPIYIIVWLIFLVVMYHVIRTTHWAGTIMFLWIKQIHM